MNRNEFLSKDKSNVYFADDNMFSGYFGENHQNASFEDLDSSDVIVVWSEDIKDANDAVIKYGRLNTLLSILDSATNSKIKVEVMRNKIAKRI